MFEVYFEECHGVPRYACTACSGNCGSVMGTSLGAIKQRGCCSYFPEYNLAELQRIVKLPGGWDVINRILKNPGTQVYNYYIHAKGSFDEAAYRHYLEKGELVETSIKDHTIFFRTCPFVVPGKGCSFEPQFRTTVCNFFICSEILELPEYAAEFSLYIKERTSYSHWMYKESFELQHILSENNLNLIKDFEGSLKLLSELELNLFEFPRLPVVYLQHSRDCA